MTEKDKKDLLRGIEQNMDMVAVSFIRTAEHIQSIRNFLIENG